MFEERGEKCLCKWGSGRDSKGSQSKLASSLVLGGRASVLDDLA